MIRKAGRVRTQFEFARPLDDPEVELLVTAILWRKNSALIRDEARNVIGAIAHPDDLSEFRKQLRAMLGTRIGVRVTAEPIDHEEFAQRMKQSAKR